MDEAQRILENRTEVPQKVHRVLGRRRNPRLGPRIWSSNHLQAESELERTPAAQGPVDFAAKEVKVSKIPENQLPKPTGTL